MIHCVAVEDLGSPLGQPFELVVDVLAYFFEGAAVERRNKAGFEGR